MSAASAPLAAKPVEVLTNWAPAALTRRQAVTISSLDNSQVSRITFTGAPAAACTTAAMSAVTAAWSPALNEPRSITMSSSSAPSARSFAAENALTSVRSVPWGNPRTAPTRTPEPASSRTASAVWRGWTINSLKRFFRALWQPARISASVVVGFRIEKSNELASSSRVIIKSLPFLRSDVVVSRPADQPGRATMSAGDTITPTASPSSWTGTPII